MNISVFWFRRDLRLSDNVALYKALQSGNPVLPLFIFDQTILRSLPYDDARVNFIYQTLKNINGELRQHNSSLLLKRGNPTQIWQLLISTYNIKNVYINKDYEPYALKRDTEILTLLKNNGITLHSYKDSVIYEENEISKKDGSPYTVYTPYKNQWLRSYESETIGNLDQPDYKNLYKHDIRLLSLNEIGYRESKIKVKPYSLDDLENYEKNRDFPGEGKTSNLGPHLRFGTISTRDIVNHNAHTNTSFLSELIWREFFMQILFHFPNVVNQNFKPKYNALAWRNNKEEFKQWCEGKTGYPIVDAGMQQLNQTGYMHNRVRMITAGFLTKHLLIDWRWGESYFAQKLLDYELSSNNGNWQWAAGTGCDAAPYFRIFNPSEQLKKFDPDYKYVKKWIPEFDIKNYIKPMVQHEFARKRALETFKKAIKYNTTDKEHHNV